MAHVFFAIQHLRFLTVQFFQNRAAALNAGRAKPEPSK